MEYKTEEYKEKKGWKVVWWPQKDYYFSATCSSRIATRRYEVGEWTFPERACGPLAVFHYKKDAVAWKKYLYGDDSDYIKPLFAVLPCLYVPADPNLRAPHSAYENCWFWYPWSMSWDPKGSEPYNPKQGYCGGDLVPKGTRTASKVKLLKGVPHRDVDGVWHTETAEKRKESE